MRPNPHKKHLLSQLDFLAMAEQARARGKSLVLTSGDFDAIDEAELRQLKSAARYGDVLLVVVSNDVQSPHCLNDAQTRAELVAAVRWVDAVVVTTTPPEWFVDALLPEAWIWNGPPEADPGRAKVQHYHGRVVQLPQPKPVQREMFLEPQSPDPAFAEHTRSMISKACATLYGPSPLQEIWKGYHEHRAPLRMFTPAAD